MKIKKHIKNSHFFLFKDGVEYYINFFYTTGCQHFLIKSTYRLEKLNIHFVCNTIHAKIKYDDDVIISTNGISFWQKYSENTLCHK